MAYADGSYRIRPGTFTAADMTVDYEVARLPVQSDQSADWPWLQPIDLSETEASGAYREHAEYIDSLDFTRRGFGGATFTWYFAPLMPQQVAFLRLHIFNGAFTAPVTVMTWDRGYDWRVVNCIARWNDPAQSARARGRGGYMDVRIDFVNGTLAASGRQFSSAFSSAFA